MRLGGLEQQIEKLLLAGLFALISARRLEALTVLVAFRPEIDLRVLAGTFGLAAPGGNVVSLDAHRIAGQTLEMLRRGEAPSPELAALTREAKGAYRAVSRKGFREQDLAEPETAEAFASGLPALARLRDHLRRFLEAFRVNRPPSGSWPAQFAADRRIFQQKFFLLYGARP